METRVVTAAASALLLAAALVMLRAGRGVPPTDDRGVECHDNSFRRSTMKLLRESPFAALFHTLDNHTKFEASGIVRHGGKYYAIFDSSRAVGYLEDEHFVFRGSRLIGDGEHEGDDDSQFEGIAYNSDEGTFLLLQEAVEVGGVIKPSIVHAKLKDDLSSYDKLRTCHVDIELSHQNKGLESIQYVQTAGGPRLLGLCEGNYCKGGSAGRDPGNGRVVVAAYNASGGGDAGCEWDVERVIELPPQAAFADYSAFAINKNLSKVAILSQEDAAVWIGDFDVATLTFPNPEGGQVFHLPRDLHCRIVYCNAEDGRRWREPAARGVWAGCRGRARSQRAARPSHPAPAPRASTRHRLDRRVARDRDERQGQEDAAPALLVRPEGPGGARLPTASGLETLQVRPGRLGGGGGAAAEGRRAWPQQAVTRIPSARA